MSIENQNSVPQPEYTEHIDAALEEARAKIFGEEVVAQAEDIARSTGEDVPRYLVEEMEQVAYLAGVAQPEKVVKEAELINAYHTEVTRAGEDLQGHEELEEDVAKEASQILMAYDPETENMTPTEYAALRKTRNAAMTEQMQRGSDEPL